jgi:hypothetical protein
MCVRHGLCAVGGFHAELVVRGLEAPSAQAQSLVFR